MVAQTQYPNVAGIVRTFDAEVVSIANRLREIRV